MEHNVKYPKLKQFLIHNREISWLSFNDRVMQEAENPSVPLLERLKFLAIFSSNLDEFFRVRVATLRRLMRLKLPASKLLYNPEEVMAHIQKVVTKQQRELERCYAKVLESLAREGVHIVDEHGMTEAQREHVRRLFRTEILPVLAPVVVDALAEFPLLRDKYIYLAIKMYNSTRPEKYRYGLLELPTKHLPRFYNIPSEEKGGDKRQVLMFIDDIIRVNMNEVFPIFEYDTFESYTVKLTRDAELDMDSDIGETLVEKLSKSLKGRLSAKPVRFVFDEQMPNDLFHFLIARMNLQRSDFIPGGRYHNFKDFMSFPVSNRPDLRYEPMPPIPHSFLDSHRRMTEAIATRDVLIHHPYQSFDYLIRFVREAAIDPQVVAIKCTLYRVAKLSNVANSLINAVRNGKRVTIFMELQARFDEETNLYWLGKFQEAGIRVISSFPNLKVHSKLLLVQRMEEGRIRNYAHLSTGNYNGQTAKLYADDALFTADRRLTTEVARVFNALEQGNKLFQYKYLLVAPHHMRNQFTALVETEIRNAKRGKPAAMMLKMNSLTDEAMIAKLYEASNEGVKIRIIVRGICSLVPGIKKMSENIEVISIIDRYLEHSRVYMFANGGDERVFLASADWMGRNLNNRVEVGFPILDKQLRREMKAIMDIQWADNTKARIIARGQFNHYRAKAVVQDAKLEGVAKHSKGKAVAVAQPVDIRAQYAIYEYLRSRQTPTMTT